MILIDVGILLMILLEVGILLMILYITLQSLMPSSRSPRALIHSSLLLASLGKRCMDKLRSFERLLPQTIHVSPGIAKYAEL